MKYQVSYELAGHLETVIVTSDLYKVESGYVMFLNRTQESPVVLTIISPTVSIQTLAQ